jgi:hypothetical protein
VPNVPYLESPGVQAEALPGRANPRIDDSSSAAAFGAPVAEGLDVISRAQTEEDAKQKVQNDNLRVIDANTQLEAGRNALLYGKPDPKTGQMTGGAFSLKGLDAMNMPDKLIPQYDKIAGDISQTLTPDQQRLFHGHIAAGSNELNLQLNRYEYEQSNQLAAKVYTNAGQQAVESASVGWKDPLVIGKSRADIKSIVQMQAQREGWPEDEKNAQTQKLLAEMHYSVVDRMLAQGNPQAALAYFVGSKDEPGVRDSNELTGAQSHQLGAEIDQALRQQSTQNSAAVANKVRDVRAAALNGQLIPPSAMPTEGELRAAYPDTWADVTDSINADVRMGADLKSMSAASPEQINAMVAGYKPQGVEGASEQYARYNEMQQAATRVQTERAKDPRQYAIDNHLGSNPLDLSNPQATGAELQSRLAALPAVSKQMGGFVPLLSKNEAATLAQSFQSQKPIDQLRTLNTLAQSMNDDRGYQLLMQQISPGAPVPAIVGNQVVSANPNTPPVWFDRNFATSPTDQARILQGNELLNPNTDEKGGKKAAFPMPPDGGIAGLRQQYSQKVGDLFRGRPELSETYYQAFKGAYASLLSDKGDVSGVGDPRLVPQALKIALGNITRFNGQEVPVPQGMDPTRFEGLVNNAVRAKVAAPAANLSDLQAAPGSIGTDASKWDKRPDGSQKGTGWLGLLRRPDGGVSSEISVGVQIRGKETDIPLLVPGLSRDEVQKIIALPNDENLAKNLPPGVLQKAQRFAEGRIAQGQSPFAGPGEKPPVTSPDALLSKIKGYTLQEQGDAGSGRYRLMNGSLPLVRPDGSGPFEIDLRGDYLPSHAHGSPEDVQRQANDAPSAPPSTDNLAGGRTRVQGPGPTDRALRPPANHAGRAKGGSGNAHPSQQAPEL